MGLCVRDADVTRSYPLGRMNRRLQCSGIDVDVDSAAEKARRDQEWIDFELAQIVFQDHSDWISMVVFL